MSKHLKSKIGILGGTFNPIHHTHLHMADVVKHHCQLDEIWFMPTKIPPHKQNEKIASKDDRIEMVRRSIKHVSYFKLCLVEFDIEGPSYTRYTMEHLQNMYPDYQFYFIIGADMVEYLPQWHKVDELIQLVHFIGVGRPGWDIDTSHPYMSYVQKVNMIPSHLSSTTIRESVREGRSIRFLVPEEVYHFIEEKGLYES